MQALGFKLTLLKVFLLEAFAVNSPEIDFSLEAVKSTQSATGEEEKEEKAVVSTSKELLAGKVGLTLISSIDPL